MDPVTIAALISGGIAAGKGIASLIPSKAERHNNQRLKELLRQEELNQLGLSPEERQRMLTQAQQQAQASQQAADIQRRQLMGEQSAGQAIRQSLAVDSLNTQQQGKALQQAVMDAQQLSLVKEQQQRQEIEQRLAAKEQSGKENLDTVFDILQVPVDAYSDVKGLQELTGTTQADDQVSMLASQYGITAEQAQQFIEFSQTEDEQLAELLGAL